ncbi:hemagglutinin repeat-containing protein [Raoultella planticola]|uniref:hemagglutinin repeat-containing protein n=1 Tax=Raoultella planticola TaxID=575 RepID=UPI001651F413|nr:hemagglutinin repeat-containing protein [Raoultella planticola]EKW3529387.1 hemagglutinin repeat-containing protein [Raoultella planticola]ELF4969106.1 hemagglutinin repeat-containing protein [Raoultella planticola]ELN0130296.1 hemagglutinin repeat-containing protein [Raoultella planticola]MCD9606627.1 hemagglutinin repeat-containing protein [Raoultella planticola]UAN08599.1 hemagglutinin repeat-containing protein [Raoultella planticola]
MNKNLYRIVFNKARGMLMVVADIARSGRAGSARASAPGRLPRQLHGKVSAISFSLWLAMGVIHPAQANIVADAGAPKNQQPTVMQSANGTPQVNIQTPSAAGVSRNTYSQFDVNQQGAILNNSHKNVQSQLGGMVAGNPWLAKGEAKVILNEVNSRDPSRLNGMIEVAGKKAQVVIANPSGITCNGCGFINANRATLTTGQAQLNNGSLTGYQVERGEVTIEGAGMDSSAADYTDIIARSVKVNAGLWAKDLKVTTGRNRVDAAHERIEKTGDDPATRPQLAVDVASLGGMYAGKIRMVGTESGVGVRNAGALGAQAGSVTLTADGRIENSGTLRASEDATVRTAGEFSNSGALTAGRHVDIQAASLTSSHSSVLAAGVQNDGKLAESGDLRLHADGQLSAHGQTLAGGSLRASGQGVDVSGSQTQGQRVELDSGAGNLLSQNAEVNARELTLRSGQTLNNDGGTLSADAITLSAQHLSNHKGKLVQTGGGALVVKLPGDIDNREGEIAANGDIQLAAQSVNNQGGKVLAAQNGSLTAHARTTLDNRKGTLAAAGDTRIDAGILNNNEGLISAATGRGDIRSAQAVSNNKGRIEAVKTQTISAAGLDNQQGVIVADGATLALADGAFNNQSGSLYSHSGLAIYSGALNNQHGYLASSGTLTFKGGDVDNRAGQFATEQTLDASFSAFLNQEGSLKALSAMTLNGGTLDNARGVVGAGGALNIGVTTLDNRQGTLFSSADALLHADRLDNQGGQLAAQRALTFNGGQLINDNSGLIQSGDSLTLTADDISNRSGSIISSANATLRSQQLQNGGGEIQSVGDLLIDSAHGIVDNVAGLMRSGATLTLAAARLINQNTSGDNRGLEAQTIGLTTGALDNQDGIILADRSLTVRNSGELNNRNGGLAASGTVDIGGDKLALFNQDGTVKAGEWLRIDADSLDGSGQLLSLGNMALSSRQSLNNRGTMVANGRFTLTSTGDIVNGGKLLAGSSLDITSRNLNNGANGEINAGQNTLNVSDTLFNAGLIDGGYMRINAGTLTNSGSGRIYGNAIGVNALTFNNLAENGTAATLAGRERVDLGVQTLNNRDHGLIYSGGDLLIGGALADNGAASGQAGTINNHSATIESAGDMTLAAGQINNINDRFTTGVVTVSQEQVTEYQHTGSPNRWNATDDGVFVDRNSADGLRNLNTPDDTGSNNDNFNQFDYTRTVEETRILESDPAKILAGGNMILTGDRLLNDKSQVIAGGTLAIAGLQEVKNDDVAGERRTTDVGSATHYYRIRHKGGDEQGRDRTAYTPPSEIQSISLKPGQLISGGSIEGTPLTIDPLTPQGTAAAIGVAGAVAGQHTVSPGEPVTPPAGQQFEVTPAEGAIRIVGPNTTLPDNSLFTVNPASDVPYLVETDPRFTNQKQWLGSDYMQHALAGDGDTTLKRLGDGYYEQRLIREQVVALTGQRYLDGYTSDEQQFKALMDQGITFGKQYALKSGVALTPEQMALLTGDIVWLVNTTVKMPDGSQQTVLVPQVYAKVKPGDIDGSGALIAGNNVNIKLDGDLFNSGTLNGRRVLQLDADTITNRAGTLSGDDVRLNARNDINNIGGIIQGGSSLQAVAGRDINATTTLADAQSVSGENRFSRTTIDSVSGIYVQGDDGRLTLHSGRDITLSGAQVVASGERGEVQLVAGRDIRLNDVTTAWQDNLVWDTDNALSQSQSRSTGSEVTGKGSVTLSAGHDLSARGALLSSGAALNLGAGNDLTLEAGENSQTLDERHKVTGSSGWLSKTTTRTEDSVSRQTARGSELNGDSVSLSAGHDLTLRDSSVAGSGDVALLAGNDLLIGTQNEYNSELHLKQEKKSGLMSSGGIGFSYGTQSVKTTDTGADATQAGSTVGSVNGDLTLRAGENLTVTGSDLIAGRDMALSGKNVAITAAENQSRQTHEVEQKTSGLTLALSGTAGSALNSVVQATQDARSAGSSRLQALQGVKAALSGVQASQAARLDAAQGNDTANNNTVGVSLSYGSQSSKSTQRSEQTTAQGSSLTAGRDLSITAREGDLNAVGSQLKAGNDVALSASRDITLQSAQNTQLLEGKNDSHGGTIGVGIGVGSGGWGISVSASANKGKGSESGNGTTHSETTVDAGNQLTLNSGRDTTLTGAQVSGDKVVMDVGRNLTLTSEQDSDRYDSRQQNASAGGSFTFGSMSGSASVNLSKDKMHSNYDSVVEQTGIFAGKGGYDITVGEHTQLNGAVIGSTATADKNRLDTGTLGWGDIDNRADFKTEHQSVGFSSGGSIGSQFAGNMANGLLTGGNNEGHDSSTTHAAISEGDIIVRDKDRQQQDVANLSRDVEHANQTLSPIFDKEKEQQRLQQTQLISEIGNQVADIARTQGEINGLEKAKAALGPLKENATEKERTAYIDALRNSDVYKAEMAKYGTGSAVQQGLQAATAAIQGLSGGDIAKAIAGGAAPYIAEVIKQTAPDEASRIMAHAAVAGVIAAVQGNSAAAGAAGAATTALMGEAIKKTLYGDIPVNQLSEDQKQTLVTLGTLAAGLAGGLASDSSASAMAGAQAGQNEISNNMASIGMLQQMMAQETLNAAAMAEAGKGTANDQAALALTKKVKEGLSASCLANDVCVLMAVVAAQSQQHADSSGSRTETLPVHDDLTGGKLVNPIQDENKGTSLITPDQSDSNSSIITISPETQPGKNDGIFINPRPVESTGTSYISESSNKNTSISAGDFFKGTTYTDKVKQQASSGDFHSFPESVDGHAHQGTISIITGGDGVERLKLEISGSYRGREGIFEYIREPNGTINHRLFVPKK